MVPSCRIPFLPNALSVAAIIGPAAGELKRQNGTLANTGDQSPQLKLGLQTGRTVAARAPSLRPTACLSYRCARRTGTLARCWPCTSKQKAFTTTTAYPEHRFREQS